MSRKGVFRDQSTGDFDDGAPIGVFPAAVASVFGRTGAVAAVAGDYFGAMPAALTGATQAARFVGATTSGAPASGTFAVGDVVVARDGHVFVCTTAGSPGTFTDVGGGAAVSYATPSIVLGSTAAAGAASTVIRSDSTIAAFDATVPSTQAFGDSAGTGSAAVAARRDHKHAMPANPSDASISVTDVTTNNATTSAHGFLKKLDNSAAHFMDGQGNWSTPAGTATGMATDPLWAAAGDLAVATGNDAATVLSIGASGKVLASNGTTPSWVYPPGYEIGYDQITGNVTVSATTEASGTTVISCAAHTFDGSPVLAEFYCNALSVGDFVIVSLFESTTQIGRFTQSATGVSAFAAHGAIRFTPSAASHTYTVTAYRGSSNGTVNAGAGGTAVYSPTFVRFTKV